MRRAGNGRQGLEYSKSIITNRHSPHQWKATISISTIFHYILNKPTEKTFINFIRNFPPLIVVITFADYCSTHNNTICGKLCLSIYFSEKPNGKLLWLGNVFWVLSYFGLSLSCQLEMNAVIHDGLVFCCLEKKSLTIYCWTYIVI